MKKIWKVNNKAPKGFLNKFPEYSKITLQLLWDRNLKTQKAIDEFFNPDYDQDLHDPFLLKDIKRVIKRMEEAGKSREKVAVFADYDADGVCGATILTEIFKIYKIKSEIYIPDRNTEGYGLNIDAVKKISKKGVSLIITIDCGVTDFEEVKLANKLGMDVIIVDHHEMPQKTPSAFAIINPKQKTCKYPFKLLSATAVAFKLAQAVAKVKKLPTYWEKWFLDLVAISTVVDSMLLLGENRSLVKYGLIVLSQTKRQGLETLMKTARVKPVYNPQTLETNLNTYTLGFILGPRINAASRVGHGLTAYKLLNTSEKTTAEKYANQLESRNKERQKLMDRIFNEARKRAQSYKKGKKIFIEGDEGWLTGVAGLIAQKIKDEFWRPCLIYQKMGTYSAGSGRSIPGFDLVKALSRCSNLLQEFGGHKLAAGFRISNKNLEKFEKAIHKIAFRELKGKQLVPILNIDCEIEINELTWPVFQKIQAFAPFGEGNQSPLFLIKKLNVSSIRKVGNNGGHLKMVLEKNGKRVGSIGFGLADFCDKIKIGDKINVVCEVIANEWNGTKELQLKIVDLKKA